MGPDGGVVVGPEAGIDLGDDDLHAGGAELTIGFGQRMVSEEKGRYEATMTVGKMLDKGSREAKSAPPTP